MRVRAYLDPTLGWRHSSDVDKVRLYTRQSGQFIVVAIVIASVVLSVQQSDAITLAATVTCGVASLVLLHRIPALGGVSDGGLRIPATILAASATVSVVAGEPKTVVWTAFIVTTPVAALIDFRWSLGLSAVATALAAALGFGPALSVALGLCIALMAATIRLSMWLLGIVTELDATRDAAAALSVAEERLRFSRDLHDVVGRALSAIAVKSELAATLARRGDDRAATQMDEVRDLARRSMTDARELVRGYRFVDVATELRGATSLLSAAGIRTDCTGNVDDVSSVAAEQAAWAIREGVTNILRHSTATYCRIELDSTRIRITNDKPHTGNVSNDGTGLRGLRERLDKAGGTLTVDARSDTFALTVRFASEEASR